MKKLIIATKNENKVREFSAMLEEHGYEVVSLFDYPDLKEPIEDGLTFEENALIKAREISKALNEMVIADDSGLCVEALNGAPGVFSARYAGEEKKYTANNELLLKNMDNQENRNAYFITVMALVDGDKELIFEGKLQGEIARTNKGTNGFGYDPIFVIEDGRHLAELSKEEKNKISHRAKAMMKVVEYLK